MRHTFLALALAAISSTAHAKIAELICTADRDHQWAVTTNDEAGTASITFMGSGGTTFRNRPAAFTPNEVQIDWASTLFFVIDRTTLRFKAGQNMDNGVVHSGTCRLGASAKRKF